MGVFKFLVQESRQPFASSPSLVSPLMSMAVPEEHAYFEAVSPRNSWCMVVNLLRPSGIAKLMGMPLTPTDEQAHNKLAHLSSGQHPLVVNQGCSGLQESL